MMRFAHSSFFIYKVCLCLRLTADGRRLLIGALRGIFYNRSLRSLALRAAKKSCAERTPLKAVSRYLSAVGIRFG